MHLPSIGAKAVAPIGNNWTTDYAPTPASYYTSPDTRAPLRTAESIDPGSSAVPADRTQSYDVEAHQRLANYASTSLDNRAEDIEAQNDAINDIFGALAGTVS